MHSGVHHTAVPRRGPLFGKVDVDVPVPGELIRPALGEEVPADVRRITDAPSIHVNARALNESVLSGESTASDEATELVNADVALNEGSVVVENYADEEAISAQSALGHNATRFESRSKGSRAIPNADSALPRCQRESSDDQLPCGRFGREHLAKPQKSCHDFAATWWY